MDEVGARGDKVVAIRWRQETWHAKEPVVVPSLQVLLDHHREQIARPGVVVPRAKLAPNHARVCPRTPAPRPSVAAVRHEWGTRPSLTESTVETPPRVATCSNS